MPCLPPRRCPRTTALRARRMDRRSMREERPKRSPSRRNDSSRMSHRRQRRPQRWYPFVCGFPPARNEFHPRSLAPPRDSAPTTRRRRRTTTTWFASPRCPRARSSSRKTCLPTRRSHGNHRDQNRHHPNHRRSPRCCVRRRTRPLPFPFGRSAGWEPSPQRPARRARSVWTISWRASGCGFYRSAATPFTPNASCPGLRNGRDAVPSARRGCWSRRTAAATTTTETTTATTTTSSSS
mmetsp:Transcript_2033/g.5367  ORF Transcript_2033/g.5367 Transcript_2033/m.5367 type:complete len:238 (+) Transcript_2033:483-1196(+)